MEESFILNGLKGLDITLLKLFILLHADDIVIVSNSEPDI